MKYTLASILLAVTLMGACATQTLQEDRGVTTQAIQAVDATTKSLIEAAFSPDGGAEALVVKAIRSSEREMVMAAYSFTSPIVVKELIDAKRRGVDVRVVVDDKGNRSKASIAALNLLVMANIPVRTVSAYAIHHDKYIVVDSKHVQTGSFNYSKAAAKSNSENVLVVWNDPDLATHYGKHWALRWDQGKPVQLSY